MSIPRARQTETPCDISAPVSSAEAQLYRCSDRPSTATAIESSRESVSSPTVSAQIISIGTELTFGLTVDTNAAWLSRRLAAIGLPVQRHVTVPDDVSAIRDAVTRGAADARYLLVTGGLGPTADDVTRQGVADAAQRPLVPHQPSLDQLRSFFLRLKRDMPESNNRQAYLPEGAIAIENSCGTAPGFGVPVGDAIVYVMPGVPHEMKQMFVSSIAPRIVAESPTSVIVTRTIRCFGGGEASMADQIEDLMAVDRNPAVGITASEGIISVRIIARGVDPSAAATLADADAEVVRDRLGRFTFGQEDDTLPQAVAKLLLDAGHTVATAESCTGGLLAKMLTDVPGSSAYFLGGLVTYGNELKTEVLGVPAELIQKHGSVSEEVAAAMAEGCRRITGADFALSATGIAGPSGGTREKPVGTVCIAHADAAETRARRLTLGERLTREAVRDRSCKAMLNFLRLQLMRERG